MAHRGSLPALLVAALLGAFVAACGGKDDGGGDHPAAGGGGGAAGSSGSGGAAVGGSEPGGGGGTSGSDAGGTASGGDAGSEEDGGAGSPGLGGAAGGPPAGGAATGGAATGGAGGEGTAGEDTGGNPAGGGDAGSPATGGSAGAPATSGGAAGAGTGGAGGVVIPDGLLDPENSTVWNPGILADTEADAPLGPDGLPVRTTVCDTVAPGDAGELQSVLDGCDPGTVVVLEAGTYTIPSTVYVPSGVVLRGNGSVGADATRVVLADGADGPVLAIGPEGVFDQTCYENSNYTAGAGVALTADAPKGSRTISIAPGDTPFAAGDFALVDELNDDTIISPGDSNGAFARQAERVLGQRVEIIAVDAVTGTLTLAGPLHWTFRESLQAQVTRGNYPVTRWAGIEHLWVQGGRGLGNWLGQRAGGIDVSNAAYCWVKDVQTDGTTNGMHVTLTGTNRCVVRDSHLHNSAQYGFGQDNYGIVVRCAGADNLVENNVARYMNKPILFNNSGGGNVVGYNYVDNQWSLDSSGGDQWQEASIDIHCTFPHMELVEGNFAPHIAASTTHGNAGYLTYFRNYASSQLAPDPIVWSLPSLPQTGNVAAMQFDETDHHMTVIGSVLGSTTDASLGVPTSLGTADVSAAYLSYGGGSPSIFQLGPEDSASVTTLRLHANFDTVNGAVTYDPALPEGTLPASLYYSSRPAWWPSDAAWPWTGPDLTPMVGALPAREGVATFDYATGNDPECTPDVGNYSCP